MTYEELGKGIVKRREQRVVGLFIDGTGLDRATRRINRKVDMASLVRGVTSGAVPVVARYYTLIPYEDDSRQRAFLDAVARAGMQVIVKRLPPKGVTRQVSVEPEMCADMVAFALGHQRFSSLSEYRSDEVRREGGNEPPSPGSADRPAAFRAPGMFPVGSAQGRLQEGRLQEGRLRVGAAKSPSSAGSPSPHEGPQSGNAEPSGAVTPSERVVSPAASPATPVENRRDGSKIQRVVTVVCPGRDVAYAIALAKELGADTVSADFGQFNTGDVLKSAAKWIDLSDSETIWRDA